LTISYYRLKKRRRRRRRRRVGDPAPSPHPTILK
jgi:hypothetical protein